MSRLGFASSKYFSTVRQPVVTVRKRTFLSEAYQCKEAWEKRLQSPLIKTINPQTLYQEIDWNYSDTGRVNAIDADIFVNANTGSGYMEDIEDVVRKLRRSPDSSNTLISSHHAVVRVLLESGQNNILLKMLNDRLTYGIFPDHYCLNLLMDTFLKAENYTAACRIAILPMLQEDWENVLTTRLAVYSCHMYLRQSNQQWYFDGELITPPPEPKETVKVQVKFLRKPYFDDHFDLKDPMQLVGKTLSLFSTKIGGSEQLANSYHLLGLILHQKWNQVLSHASSLSDGKKSVHREVIELAQKFLEEKPKAEVPEVEQKSAGKISKPDAAKEAEAEAELAAKKRVMESLASLEALSTGEDLLSEMSLLVKDSVHQNETKEIDKQVESYKKWEQERMRVLQLHQEAVKREETVKRIEQQKMELIEREKEIFFFENEDKLDLMIEEKEAALAEIEKKRAKIKQTSESKDADYVPPEVFKRVK